MNKQDAAVIKVLSELGLRDDPEIRPEFKNLYPKDDPNEQFYDDVIKLFREDLSDTLGGWLPDHVEMMSLDVLSQWVEDVSWKDDWSGKPETDLGSQAFASQDLTKQPIRMSYDWRTGKAMVRDPRYVAMREAGFSHAPVMVIQSNLHGRGVEVPTPVGRQAWITPNDLGFEVKE